MTAISADYSGSNKFINLNMLLHKKINKGGNYAWTWFL